MTLTGIVPITRSQHTASFFSYSDASLCSTLFFTFLAVLHSASNQGFLGKVLLPERLRLKHACNQDGNHIVNINSSCQQWNKVHEQLCSQTLLVCISL